ncbi:MAG: tRNA lysidine(34) synthetase TilS, partial [Candidatus Korobacteraceae bacterium]
PVREKILQSIREQKLMRAGDRVAVAVSGGADSVALLRVLLELREEIGVVLAVAHFNHGLRGAESDADQAFVAELARQSGLEFFAGLGDVRDHAVLNKLSVEAAGRELRYAWFARLAAAKRLDAIATAHTLDDQAETVLLKFLRGAGTRGLAGIWPVLGLELSCEAAGAKALFKEAFDGAAEAAPLQDRAPRLQAAEAAPPAEEFVSGHEFTRGDMRPFHPESASAGGTLHGTARIVRPLLGVTRDEVEAYLESLGQSWREDTSNLDHRFLRNRVRHELLPLLEREYNPNIRQALSDVAEIARAEEEYWQNEVERELARRTRGPGLKPEGMPRADAGLKARSTAEKRLSDTLEKAGPSTRTKVLGRDDNIGGEHADTGLKARSSTETKRGPSEAFGRLLIESFVRLPIALQRRVLKSFAERHGVALDFEHVENLRNCALGDLARTELPGGLIAVNAKQWLELRSCAQTTAAEYEVVLPIPGEARIAELGLTVRATIVPDEFGREVPPGELLSRDLIGAELTIRNWRPGDRFWAAHSGSEEKLKRLFAEKKISADERPTWPVAQHEGEIVWVRGFPVAKAYGWSGTGDGVKIEALPTKE